MASIWGRVILLAVLIVVFSGSVQSVYLLQRGALQGVIDGQTDALTRVLEDPGVMARLVLMQALIGLAAVAGMAVLVDRRPLVDLGLGGGRGGGIPSIFWGLVIGVVLASVVTLFIAAVSGRHVHPDWFLNATWPGVAGIVVTLVVAALMEEALFRGYLFVNLGEGYGTGRTILLTAVAFAAVHGSNPDGGILAWFNIFLVGVVLAQLRVLTGGLPVPFGLHLGWNLALGIGYGMPVSGITMPSALRISTTDLAVPLGGGGFGPEASLVVTALFGGLALVLLRRLRPPGDAVRPAG